MKFKLTFILACLFSLTAFASESRIISQTEFTVTLHPMINGHFLRANSNQDVVCEKLGYPHGAVKGASVKDPWHHFVSAGQTVITVKVKADGSLSRPINDQRVLYQLSCWK